MADGQQVWFPVYRNTGTEPMLQKPSEDECYFTHYTEETDNYDTKG